MDGPERLKGRPGTTEQDVREWKGLRLKRAQGGMRNIEHVLRRRQRGVGLGKGCRDGISDRE
ncbi:MAG: hypothetical protein LBP69_02285 [Treponema sp.]|jgi:hypothetical protein|nr:hypothetical protein [Treponema sp.]